MQDRLAGLLVSRKENYFLAHYCINKALLVFV